MTSRRLAAAAVAGLIAAACSAGDDDTASPAEPSTTTAAEVALPSSVPSAPSAGPTAPSGVPATAETTAAGSERPTFGTLASPCGPAGPAGPPTIADGQNGGATLRLGTATDHGFAARPISIEMLDAAEAFAGWCNAQGGIRGLPLEIVDLDGKLFEVPAAVEKACAEAFAVVGGGWAFDDQMFPRFHECGMVGFAGYTVTAPAAQSNAIVQAVPNPVFEKPVSWLLWAKRQHPEAIQRTAILYVDFLTTQIQLRSVEAQLAAVGGFTVVDRIPINPTGEANWVPFAQRLKENQIGFVTIVAEAGAALALHRAMQEVGYVPELVLNDSQFYSRELVAEGAREYTEGTKARLAFVPLEEPDDHPALQSYLAMMDEYNPDGLRAALGMQATSAFLLFATAANDCVDANDNVLERRCVLAAGRTITSWTGGGLHAETDPAENRPPACGMIVEVRDGQWSRLYPELGSPDDDGDGFHCAGEEAIVTIEGDFGDPAPGINPDLPS